jgi:prepilin-type processing-associated H-X9-DG protein
MSLTRLKIMLACLLVPVAVAGVCVAGVSLYLATATTAAGDESTAVAPEPAPPLTQEEPPKAAGQAAETDDAVKDAPLRMRSQNNLKAIGLALHNYHDTHGHFPAPAIYSKDGKPLLSWRVAILPWLEQDAVYREFHLDEPWDSPHNKPLSDLVLPVYAPLGARSGARSAGPGLTYYQAFVGKGAGFEPHKELRIPDFTDGTSNTLLVVEAATPVPWAKPEDLPFVADQALPRLGGLFGGDFNALFADGSVNLLSKKADPDMLRAAITRNGGEVLDTEKLIAGRFSPSGGVRVTTEQVTRNNARLKEAVAKTLKEVEQLKEDVGLLKTRLAHGEAALDAGTAKLLQQNQELQDSLQRALQELDSLKAEKARLEKELDRGRKEKP